MSSTDSPTFNPDAPDISPDFGHVKLSAEGLERYQAAGRHFTLLWRALRGEGVEFGPEGTLCLRRLQEARFWASKAISSNPDNQEK